MVTLGFCSKDYRRRRCIACLLCYLAQYEPFVKKLEDLKQDYPVLAGYAWEAVLRLQSMQDPQPDEELCCKEAREYCGRLLLLVEDYGLNPDWAMERIHNSLNAPRTLGSLLVDNFVVPPMRIAITVEAEPPVTKDEARRLVLRQFEEKWPESESRVKQAGLVKERQGGELPKHMRWVFKRVCLKKNWEEIADSEIAEVDKDRVVGSDAIRNSATPIIRQLGLRSSSAERKKN